MIYIELLILEDFIYNYVILFSVGILLKRITNVKRTIIASLVGTISIITFFISSLNILKLIISFLFSLVMVIISFSYKNIIYTIKNIFYMYISTMFIAGTIYLINTNIIANINNYLFSVIFLILIAPIITLIYLKSIKNITNDYSNYYKLDIYLDKENIVTTTGFLDTGNKLKDPYKQRPIILIDKKLIKNNNQKTFLVPYKTISDESLLKCIIPKKIYIENIGYRKNFLIGLVDEINIEGADCILHQKLLERI